MAMIGERVNYKKKGENREGIIKDKILAPYYVNKRLIGIIDHYVIQPSNIQGLDILPCVPTMFEITDDGDDEGFYSMD